VKPRIIHIHGRDFSRWFPPMGTDEWYLSHWSGVIAKNTVSYTDRYDVESWRAEPAISEVQTRTVSGVVCRIFPARTERDLKYGPPMMWDHLRSFSRQGRVIVHHCGIHLTGFYWLLRHFSHLPIVGQHHGEARPFARYNLRARPKRVAQWVTEAAFLRRATHFLHLRESERQYLQVLAPKVPSTFLTVGTEFDRPLLDTMSRSDAKSELGFDPGRPLVLYVGRFFRQKSVEHILQTRQYLATRSPARFCLVGGSDKDDLFRQVVASGVEWRRFLPHGDVMAYYRAADLYLSPFFIYEGFDVSVMEALSFGVPVVSRLLDELPAEERPSLGHAVRRPDELGPAVLDALDHPERFADTRQIAQRWFAWETITRRLLRVYDDVCAA
jgi:glycosyltransferase involved in cell wall biosynthesis